MTKDQQIVQKYKKENPWGMSTCIDLYHCNPQTLRSAREIKRFVKELCGLIEMKTFGETVVVNFGEDPRVSGFSMTQLIETSLISGHFANNSNAIYLDVFSCKPYPPYKTAQFAKKFFEGKKMDIKVNFRY
ncbi:MAG: S-adenosylmethionine decarboxylase [Parcubacteria group bacterium]|jgi:S-adenosylmethionine/arginine decarboxylase-like enzyme